MSDTWRDRLRERGRPPRDVADALAGVAVGADGSRDWSAEDGLEPPARPVRRQWWKRLEPLTRGASRGKWARVYVAPSQTCATSTAYYLRAGVAGGIPPGVWEFASRTEEDEKGARVYSVWGRWIGEASSAGDTSREEG